MIFALTKMLIIAIPLCKLAPGHSSSNRLLYLASMLLVFICWLSYMMIKVGIPYLKGKTALELDNEKLQYFVKEWIPLQYYREVIYWKDVQDIEFNSFSRIGQLITFRITDGGNDASIYTKYIASGNDNLGNIIQEYLKNSR